MGAEVVLQSVLSQKVSPESKETFRGCGGGIGGIKAGRLYVLGKADDVYILGVDVEVCHRGSHYICLQNTRKPACDMDAAVGDMDGVHIDTYTRWQWGGGTYVSSLLFRFPAQCFRSNSGGIVVESHILLSISDYGIDGLAKVDGEK